MKTTIKLLIIFAVIVLLSAFTFVYLFLKKLQSDGLPTNQNEDEMVHLVKKVNYNSEWDSSDLHRITPFLAKAQFVLGHSDVTLVTQCSFQNLFLLPKLIDTWQGPVSLSIFSRGPDVQQVLLLVMKLRHCHEAVKLYVTFHLVTYEGNGNLKYIPTGPLDCSSLPDEERNKRRQDSANYDLSVPYPVNLMRNVARRGLATAIFLLIDIDMVPNRGLRQDVIDLMSRVVLDNMTVFIVPAFELASPVPVPGTKFEVKTLVQRGVMRPFYAELCPKCHACVDYPAWLNLPNRTGLSVAYQTSWTDPCEPFYIGRVDIPSYDETFKQYGFNRISQVCELHVAGFGFSILDNAFLTHLGMKTKDSFHRNKEVEQEINRARFRDFKQNLKFKYPSSRRRC